MILIRWFIISLVFLQSLQAYTLYDNRVEDKIWKSGETLLGFLQENLIPMRLYYEMDAEDEKLVGDIRFASVCYILRDADYNVVQALIPLNEELQLHILRDNNNSYSMSVEPILYQVEDKSFLISLDDVFSKDIVNKTGNFPLAVLLEQMFKKSISFKKLKLGDKVAVFYKQKRRLGKFYGTQKVVAAMIQKGSKKHYLFADKDGSYFDSFGKKTDTSSFITPCRYKRVSSRFTNKRWHPILKKYRAHHGIDYAGPTGTKINAAYAGKVIFMGTKGGYGKTIIIRHAGGYKTLYAHLNGFNNAVRGARVKTGQHIGYMGSTGRSTGPHLHFGLSLNDRWINPETKIVLKSGLSGAKKREFLKIVKEYKDKIEKLLKES